VVAEHYDDDDDNDNDNDNERQQTGRKARLWDKARVKRESHILGPDGPALLDDNVPVGLGEFVMPCDDIYETPPPAITVSLTDFELEKSDTVSSAPTTYAAYLAFQVNVVSAEETALYRFSLDRNANFATAHPCALKHEITVERQSRRSMAIRCIHEEGQPAGEGFTHLTG